MIDPKQGPLFIPRQSLKGSCELSEPHRNFMRQNVMNVANLDLERDTRLHDVRLPVLP